MNPEAPSDEKLRIRIRSRSLKDDKEIRVMLGEEEITRLLAKTLLITTLITLLNYAI